MVFKRKLLRIDGIVQAYTFKNRRTFKERYQFTGKRKGRFKLFQTTRPCKIRTQTIRSKTIEKMRTKRSVVAQLKAIRKKTVNIPKITEVRKMIESKLLVPYEKRYSIPPTRQESFKMYRFWLKSKGLSDMRLISRISSVDSKVMKDGIKAYITMFNEKNKYVGMITVYGILPHDVKLIEKSIKGLDYKDGIADSPGKLSKTIDELKDTLKEWNIIRSMKRQIQEETGDYRVTRLEYRFDFA